MAERRDRAAVARQVARLGRQGCLTERDELLLRTVAEVAGLTLDQARRLLWPEASLVVAYQRLNKLRGWRLLRSTPLPPAAAAWGLGPGPVYQLGPAGQLWLQPEAALDWQGRPGRWTAPLLAAELLVRLVEQEQVVRWRGPAAVQAGLKQDLPVAGAAQWQRGEIMFHVAGLAQRSVDWSGLVRAFDQAARSQRQPLPPVGLLLPDTARIPLVSDMIIRRRRGPVSYLLAAWPDLAGAADLTTAAIWQYLPPDNAPVPGQSLAGLTAG